MTKDEARQIVAWRKACTLRSVAFRAHEAGIEGGDWEPPDNQIVGRFLLEEAAKMLGLDVRKTVWKI